MKKIYRYFFLTCFLFSCCLQHSFAVVYVEQSPVNLSNQAKKYQLKDKIKIPGLTWAAEALTYYFGNGLSKTTKSDSIFGKAGFNIEFYVQNDIKKGAQDLVDGVTPFFRGTVGQAAMVSEALQKSGIKLVPFLKLSDSLGDALVVKSKINKINDLKGSTIVVQAYGPHFDALLEAVLKTANLSSNDVNLKYVKDITISDSGSDPIAAFKDPKVSAAFVVYPDALSLTTGDSRVPGSKILFTTVSTPKAISDELYVREDFLNENREWCGKLLNAFFNSQEQGEEFIKNKSKHLDKYNKLMSVAAADLFEDPQGIDLMDSFYYDKNTYFPAAEISGFLGNKRYYSEDNFNSFSKKMERTQKILIDMGLLSKMIPFASNNFDYDALKAGVTKTTKQQVVFNKDKVDKFLADRLYKGTDQDIIYQFTVYFKVGQSGLDSNQNKKDILKVVELANTFGGAVMEIGGYSDPTQYVKTLLQEMPKFGIKPSKKVIRELFRTGELDKKSQVLSRVRQAAKNLSLQRANNVRSQILKEAKSFQITLNESQFAATGYGIQGVPNPLPQTKAEQSENRSVVFRLINIEAESSELLDLSEIPDF